MYDPYVSCEFVKFDEIYEIVDNCIYYILSNENVGQMIDAAKINTSKTPYTYVFILVLVVIMSEYSEFLSITSFIFININLYQK